MKVRIQNDGGPGWKTQITDAETGKPIPSVTRIDLTMDVKSVPTAILTTVLPIVDVVVDAEVKCICPVCGRPEEKPNKLQTLIDFVKAWEEEQERLRIEQEASNNG